MKLISILFGSRREYTLDAEPDLHYKVHLTINKWHVFAGDSATIHRGIVERGRELNNNCPKEHAIRFIQLTTRKLMLYF